MNLASTGGAFVASLVLLIAVLSLGEQGNCLDIPDSITSLINANLNGSATVNLETVNWCIGWDNAYQLSVASVGLVLSLIGCTLIKCKPNILTAQLGRCQLPFLGPLTIDLLLSSLLFMWLTVGAMVLTTMEDGGFTTTSNGYFACWAGSFTSIGNLGVSRDTAGAHLEKTGPAFGLMIASIVVLIAALPEFQNRLMILYAFIVALVSVVFSAVFLLFGEKIDAKCSGKLGDALKLVVLLAWIVEAMWTTFPSGSPFYTTGNGYFGSWLGVVTATQLSSLKLFNLEGRHNVNPYKSSHSDNFGAQSNTYGGSEPV